MLVVAQLVLPPIATSIARHRLAKNGKVISIKLSAFPAIELAWRRVGKLDLKMENYDATAGQMLSQLQEASSVGTMNVAIETLTTNGVTLRDVRVTKANGEMVLHARLETKELQSALPVLKSLTPVKSIDGDLTLRGTADVLGASVGANAIVAAQDGKVVIAPQGVLGAFGKITVFSAPGVEVQEIKGKATGGGVLITARAKFK